MKDLFTKAFIALLGFTPLFAQNGDRKGHDVMGNIVPEELIPAVPVLTVEQALEQFSIQKGFVIEPVAAEPLVESPIALTFDNRGRMWVVEMRGYMPDIDGKLENDPTGRIAILEDTNGDGKADKRITFLDNLVLPRTVAIVPGGVLYGDEKNLYFVERDGDTPKGEPVIVDDQYSVGANVEHKTNGLMTNIDNWMYNAKSDRRYRFNPKNNSVTSQHTEFRGQWGITHDNFGRLFHNSNSTLLSGDRVLPNLLLGNKAVKMKNETSVRIGSNRIYPGRVTPGVNRAYISTLNGYDKDTIDPKTFKLMNASGACGPVIYRGNNFPQSYNGQAFVCESAVQMVKLIDVQSDGSKLTGSHPLGEEEFLTSTDERFRPVNLYNAPDGSLYLLDFYHGIIQHKTYMTTYLRNQILSRGLDRPSYGYGRIYRIRAEDQELAKAPNLEKASQAELADHLAHPIGIVRDLAQKELIARESDPSIIAQKLASNEGDEIALVHQIWTLQGLGALTAKHLAKPLQSENPELVASALYAALTLPESEQIQLIAAATKSAANDLTSIYKARFLAAIPKDEAQEALVTLLTQQHQSNFVKEAAISGMSKTAKLFSEVNNGRFTNKKFDQLLKKSKEGPKKEIDPASLLSGDHLISFNRGKDLYNGRAACSGCHGQDGGGIQNLGPQLDNSDWVTSEEDKLVKVLLHGLTGPIMINGKKFTPLAFMPGLAQNPSISDQDIGDIATFLRANWTNRASQVSAEEVAEIRAATQDRSAGQMYRQDDFPEMVK